MPEQLNVSKQNNVALHGIGTAVPQGSLSQADALIENRRLSQPSSLQEIWLRSIYEKSLIEKRHSVLVSDESLLAQNNKSLFSPSKHEHDRGPTTAQRMLAYEEHAPKLASQACREAIAKSSFSAKEVTHLVLVTCTGFAAPGLESYLQDDLQLCMNIQRTNVGFMGCHGVMNGLRVAAAYADSDPKAVILVCSVELCSLHYQYGFRPDHLVANAIFSDGSAAVVVSSQPRRSSGTAVGDWRWKHSGSQRLQGTKDQMSWKIGDHGFEMTLSPQVPILLEQHLASWLHPWLASFGLTMENITSWAVHPGGPKILESVQKSLGLSRSALQCSWDVLARYGNMSSATLLFLLDQLLTVGTSGNCLMLGFGPGLTIEAAVLSMSSQTP